MKSMLFSTHIVLLSLAWSGISLQAGAQSASNDLDTMSLEELLGQRSALHSSTTTGSTIAESIRDAAAAMVVVTETQIKRRGYDSIDDIVADLPGFDTVVTNGTMQVVSYQRGYRTPWTQRTLLLINGRVDNHLWNHSAQLSRQYPINSIERVEVLYGPSGAIYGPNAFLGVINIITKNGRDLAPNATRVTATVTAGSFNSQAIDLNLRGNHSGVSFNLGGRLFESDEPGINDYSTWGFAHPALLSDPSIWGSGIGLGSDPATGNASPIGDINVDGIVQSREKRRGAPLGYYQDPSVNRGLFADISTGNWTIGGSHWKTDEGYGPYYSFADAQPNAHWIHTSNQLFLNNVTHLDDNTNLSTDLVYRDNRVGGDWTESFAGDVSLSKWNNFNKAWRFEQQLNHAIDNNISVSAGIKYEEKQLAKHYMICNYFDGLGICPAQGPNSSDGISSDGSGVVNVADISSLKPTPFSPWLSERSIPTYNQANTIDRGVFGQLIYDYSNWRFNLGLRWDKNSEYGSDTNPRAAAIYHYSAATTFKLIYGEAFQEPSPKELYGEYNGRAANSTLIPEKAKNLELIAIHQGEIVLHDVSIFLARYDNVIAGSRNVGSREIQGFEYRGDIRIDNFLNNSADITAKLFYTYTRAMADQQFDQATEIWINDSDEQGDIAPHKLTSIINIPIKEQWNFNLRGNWVSARTLFSQNPLREQKIQAKSFFKLDANLLYEAKSWQLGFKVENLFGKDYLMPGVESASSGNNFAQDTDGFQNSLLPQVKDPVYSLSLRVEL